MVTAICRHCGQRIVSDNEGDYVHEYSDEYSCRAHAIDMNLPPIYHYTLVAEPLRDEDIVDRILTKYSNERREIHP